MRRRKNNAVLQIKKTRRLPIFLLIALGLIVGIICPACLTASVRQSATLQIASPQPSNAQKKEGQQDDKPIRLSADLVTVLITVTDLRGNLVTDLTKDDFEVYENDARQDIAGLYKEEEKALRLVFLFDTSTSIRSRFDFEKRAAAQFFRQVLRPNDEAAIMSVATSAKLESGFSPNLEKLVNTLDRIEVGGATALYQAADEAARYLGKTPGRHVILVLSDGVDTASGNTLAQALKEVQKSDVVAYTIHSMGVPPSANVQELEGDDLLRFPFFFDDNIFNLQVLDRVAGGVRYRDRHLDQPRSEAKGLILILSRLWC